MNSGYGIPPDRRLSKTVSPTRNGDVLTTGPPHPNTRIDEFLPGGMGAQA